MDRRQRSVPGSYAVKRSGNRRAYPRWSAQFEVRYTVDRKLVTGTPVEMAEGGMSFLGEDIPAMGTELDLEYRLASEKNWVKVKAAVRHIRDRHVGVEFLNLKLADRLKIVEHVTGMQQKTSA